MAGAPRHGVNLVLLPVQERRKFTAATTHTPVETKWERGVAPASGLATDLTDCLVCWGSSDVELVHCHKQVAALVEVDGDEVDRLPALLRASLGSSEEDGFGVRLGGSSCDGGETKWLSRKRGASSLPRFGRHESTRSSAATERYL